MLILLKRREIEMQPLTSVTIEGKTVKVGEWVGFKSDIEQSGKIVAIKRGTRGPVLVLENPNGFDGGYIGGQRTTEVDAADCW
jgi:hypothetical protein